jgi:hypothetical protein
LPLETLTQEILQTEFDFDENIGIQKKTADDIFDFA